MTLPLLLISLYLLQLLSAAEVPENFYFASEELYSWRNSSFFCHAPYFHDIFTLPVIQNKTQNKLVQYALQFAMQQTLQKIPTNNAGSSEAWIGGLRKNGTFYWSSNESFVYTNWEHGVEPSPSSENCVYITAEGYWKTGSCELMKRVICQSQVVTKLYVSVGELGTYDKTEAANACGQSGTSLTKVFSRSSNRFIQVTANNPPPSTFVPVTSSPMATLGPSTRTHRPSHPSKTLHPTKHHAPTRKPVKHHHTPRPTHLCNSEVKSCPPKHRLGHKHRHRHRPIREYKYAEPNLPAQLGSTIYIGSFNEKISKDNGLSVNTFRWDNGRSFEPLSYIPETLSTITFTNWDKGYPKPSPDFGCVIIDSLTGLWRNVPCIGHATRIVCEQNVISKRFFVGNSKLNFLEASAYCARYNAQLATIKSTKELSDAQSIIVETFGQANARVGLWLSAQRFSNRTLKLETWEWADGQVIQLNGFNIGLKYLKGQSGDCLYIKGDTWFVTSCTSRYYPLCEASNGPTLNATNITACPEICSPVKIGDGVWCVYFSLSLLSWSANNF